MNENISYEDCFALIEEFDKVIADCEGCFKVGRGYLRFTLEGDKLLNYLNEVLIGGYVKKITQSNNEELISNFYYTFQEKHKKINGYSSVSYSSEINSILNQIKDSLFIALPNGDKIKKIIESNDKIKEEHDKEKSKKNILNEMKKEIKDKIIEISIFISILIIGLALCYVFNKAVFLVYTLIISCGLLYSVISNTRRIKNITEKDINSYEIHKILKSLN